MIIFFVATHLLVAHYHLIEENGGRLHFSKEARSCFFVFFFVDLGYMPNDHQGLSGFNQALINCSIIVA